MSKSRLCHFNKFGFCKYGKQCFRYHEAKVCENVSCKVLECSLRHPQKCRFYSEYSYCKFGSYCKFSHKKEVTSRGIKLIEKEVDEVKKQLKEKDIEIKKIEDEIRTIEKKKEADLKIIILKNEALEKELKDVRQENKIIKENISFLRDEFETIKIKFMGNNQDKQKEQIEEIEEEDEPAEHSPVAESGNEKDLSTICDKCEFVAKSEGGLKTHKTVKHNTVSLRGYRKVTQ